MPTPVLSMTGFGAASAENGPVAASVEIKSVNNRGLKISVRSRPGLGVYEKRLRDLVSANISRGSVDVHVNFTRAGGGEASIIRADAAREAVSALRRLAGELGLADNISARDLAAIPGVFEHSAEEPATEEEWPIIEEALRQAIGQAGEMRRTEGATLAAVLRDLAEPLEKFVESANQLAPRALERSREKLRLRLAELCPDGFAPADQQALEREMCLIADKADVREELDRLTSHLEQYCRALGEGGEIGKRLEFLAQEFLREINTTASKINDTDVIQEAVKAKLTVEKIKEQAANLE